MNFKLDLFAIIGSLLLLLVIFELNRRRYLQVRYSLIWIITGTLFLVISVRIDILYWVSRHLGFAVPSNALFFLGILFLILIALSLSVITSGLAEKNKTLTQEVVLLKKKVADLEETDAAGKKTL